MAQAPFLIFTGPAVFQCDETKTCFRMATYDGRFEVVTQKVGELIDTNDADEMQAAGTLMQVLLMSKVIAWVYRQGRT